MFFKLRRYYNQNKGLFILIILIAIFAFSMFQVFKNAFLKSDNINLELEQNNESNIVEVNNINNSIISNYPAISSKINSYTKDDAKKSNEVLNNFINKCNNKEIEEAYTFLSEETKEYFYPNIESFENDYINKLYSSTKNYKITPWMFGKYKVYQIDIYQDEMSTGKINTSNTITNYYTVIKQNDEYKINLNKLIAKEELNRVTENEYLTFTVISRNIYMDYEEYKIKITNKTDKTILLNRKQNIDKCYLQDSVSNKIASNINEIPENLLLVRPALSNTLNIKFNKPYKEEITSKQISFEDIVLDYYIYIQNSFDYTDTLKTEVTL